MGLLCRCASPIEMADIPFTNLEDHSLRCLDLYGHRPETDASIVVGILVGRYLL